MSSEQVQTDNREGPAVQFAMGATGPFGKFDAGVVKTHLDERTHYLWLQLCAELKTHSSELMRDAIYRMVYQRSSSEMTADLRAPILDRLGPNEVRAQQEAR